MRTGAFPGYTYPVTRLRSRRALLAFAVLAPVLAIWAGAPRLRAAAAASEPAPAGQAASAPSGQSGSAAPAPSTGAPAAPGATAPPPAFQERVSVVLRRIDFLALDRKGQPITDLKKEELRLWEDGDPQTVDQILPAHEREAVEAATAVPAGAVAPGKPDAGAPAPPAATGAFPSAPRVGRWIILLIDAKNLSYQSRVLAGPSLKTFVEKEVRPEDQVSLMIDELDLRIAVPFTQRKDEILAALENPEALTTTQRDIERILKDLRTDTEDCREAPGMQQCLRQVALGFLSQTGPQTERSLEHLENLLRSLAAIPDRKILVYVSDGMLIDPGDIATAAVEHSIGQWGYNLTEMRSLLQRAYRDRMAKIQLLATRSRTGFYPVVPIRKMTDEVFTAERTQGYGPENLPQARTDPFEATWQQVYQLNTELAQATGGIAKFQREPKEIGAQIGFASGVYTVYYYPTDPGVKKKVRIRIERKGAEARYLDRPPAESLEPPLELPGDLVVDPSKWDPMTNGVRVEVRVAEGDFAIVPDSAPPVSYASIFLELRDGTGKLLRQKFQTVSLPRGQSTGQVVRGRLVYPFELRLPAGSYQVRVDLQDLFGPARGSYTNTFQIDPAALRQAAPQPPAGSGG